MQTKGGRLLYFQISSLIALQVMATSILWYLNPITQAQTDAFALYLSIDLIAFAMLSYQYRGARQGMEPSRLWIALGWLSLIVFFGCILLVVL